ncbi:zinc-binding alcohol dehydrogenase family protein [Tumebacillus sp. ITR2]|uniref:Zinc-binding alcohol dehydrogenase family protein n=1 Tax=Tumebacillus amylolyticus TaxID=2801339 RepID=A0ABS1J505_9BACL|nr:zinc-binding dehydrogenase [Tumebacillus amylolyticus]MBL0385346.1 zinc-binding alcohol dehydrogenase family protein [Tumebacillus amylolyticus]
MKQGNRYGLHRVLEPVGTMPQPAWRIDNTMDLYSNEILLDVETLNIDSASFVQIKEAESGDQERIGEHMKKIVAERGKHHNPVTGSGGMLIGTVRAVGVELAGHIDLQPGDRIATLVSLSLTPLTIDEITHMDVKTGQVSIKGQAILFESGLYAKLPEGIPDRIALAVLDVCGAPAQTEKLVQEGHTVVVLGAGGKSGTMVLCQARKSAGPTGKIIAVEYGEAGCERLRELGWADEVLNLDCTKPVDVLQAVEKATSGRMADVTINCVNIPNTEMASILATKDEGTVYFFSMATSFTAAALGAEGVGKDVQMIIGNGYTKGHAEMSLNLLRESEQLQAIFEAKYQ